MNKYAGTKTEKNLQAAFAGESQARNKYTYFSSVAKKEGYEQISDLFLKTADNEKEHAKMWFKELGGIGNTAEPCGGCGRRKFRVDGYVRRIRKDGGRRRLHRACREIPSCGGDRKTSRRKIQSASEKRRDRGSVQKERSESVGMQKLRSYRRRYASPSGVPCLRPSTELF